MISRRIARLPLPLALALATLATAALWSGCNNDKKARASSQNASGEAAEIPVEVAEVGTRSFPQRVRVSANVLAEKKATVLPKIPGTIVTMHADVGDVVGDSDDLATLDDTDLRIGLKQVLAGVGQAEAGVAQARVNRDMAERSYRRFKRLHDAKTIPDVDFEKVDTGFRMAKAQVKLAQAGLRAARVAVESVKQKLEYTSVKAPFAGVVTMRFKDPGEMAAPQTPLYVVMDMVPAKVEGALTEADAVRVKADDTVTIALDAFPGETIDGKVERVDPSVDRVSRTVKVRVSTPNQDMRLKPGMAAILIIDLGSQEHLAAPRQAVTVDGVGRGHVFVATEGGIAKRRDISIAEGTGAWMKVTGGLSAGERVVTTGVSNVHDGAKIIVDAPGGAQ